MRSAILTLLMLSLCGCVHLKLERTAVSQGSTISDIQYQQVLDNLAHFACDPNSMAWHVKLTGGLVQVADQGNAAVLPSGAGNTLVSPSVAVSRNVLGQWNVEPVIESDDLELLQLAYQKAINPADPTRELKKQVFEKVAELSVAYHIVLAPAVADEMIESMMIGTAGPRLERLAWTRGRLVELYRRVDELSGADKQFDTHGPGGSLGLTPLAVAKKEIVQLVAGIGKQTFIASSSIDKPQRSPNVIEQAEDKISALVDLVTDRGDEPNQFLTPWIDRGCKKRDVPKCACQSGHYCGCQGECYVWITADHAKTLRDFTLIILSLAPPDVQEMSLPKLGVGAAFSPGF
jgi:hypothetical protein